MSVFGRCVLLAGGLLIGLMGCVDFEQQGRDFCLRNPERCGAKGRDGGAGEDGGSGTHPDAGPFLPPLLIERPQASFEVTAGGRLTFNGRAQDPQDSAMRFAWTATVGSLDTAQDTSTTSQIVWTAPPCLDPGVTASFTLTVSNAFDLAVIARFSATGIPICPVWTSASSMSVGRSGATVTLLQSGKVLVAGGRSGPIETLASAELYDPATGNWASTGNMSSLRTNHTATLLPSGKVLVAGGSNGTAALSSAEVYDPAAGTWGPAGSLTTARTYATATLLLSGKVLVVGGTDHDLTMSTATAQLYDPGTNTWASTGSMPSGRGYHCALLLPSGQVLVAGGFNSRNSPGALSSADIYDPEAGAWHSVGSMSTYRISFTATLLPSGKVLVTTDKDGRAELYDPESGTWALTGSMVVGSQGHTATLLPSGTVLVTGGYGKDGDAPRVTAQMYEPVTGTWTATLPLSTGRSVHTATLLPSGKVLVVGGHGPSGPLNTAELYRP
ncbi:Kelch repeat-containing protein [Corallococcus terminator]|nr:kelch repeat-containing protein [Corallococcus terminator]